MTLVFLAAFAAAILAGALATRTVRDLALRYDHLDLPDARKAHVRAVPRVGGVGIATGAAVGLGTLVVGAALTGVTLPLAGLAPVVAGASIVFALGLWDDFAAVGFKVRFVVQAFVAWAMTLAGWHVDLSNVPLIEWLGPFEQAAISVPLTVLWTVGLINAMNLLDGLDALAGGTALIGFTALAVAFFPAGDPVLLALCVLGVGGVAGFLVFNRHPASIFMGDGGSTLLGFLLAMAAVRGVAEMPTGGLVILPVVALGLPILDTLTTMLRRMADGQSPFLPDADHLHHRTLARSHNVHTAVAKLHLTAVVFGALAVVLRLVAGHPEQQAVVLLVTAAFAYAVIRHLGYVRTRDLASIIQRRVRRGMQMRIERRLLVEKARAQQADASASVVPRDGSAGGDGAAGSGTPRLHRAPRPA